MMDTILRASDLRQEIESRERELDENASEIRYLREQNRYIENELVGFRRAHAEAVIREQHEPPKTDEELAREEQEQAEIERQRRLLRRRYGKEQVATVRDFWIRA